METSMGNLFMSEESMGAKARSWASIRLGTESDHKGKKERIKNIIEENRSKKKVRESILFSARSTFLKGGHYCC